MSTTMTCDGCGRRLTPESPAHAVHGENPGTVIRSGADTIPDEFDWCVSCARAAFRLLAAHVAEQRATTTDGCDQGPQVLTPRDVAAAPR